eukprot:TRINITY_DN5869_c0_g1_i1.p1 TRINITY_DN5869_c0_g1~~TRINITY_DN5869_c0_g1_i1.p1  ORF type:complete len:237 (-),score=68.95 TRINITY_DN5869_c0_g1_i1:49-759(-)
MDPCDEPPFPAMSPTEPAELTEEAQDKQNGLKQQGVDLLEDGKLDLALEKFTEAISVGCASALMYSRRAQILLQLDRPRASVNDCNAALEINPDSAKAFKTRGRAYKKLEMWLEAHSDFSTALKLDFDEQTEEDSREVAEKAKELQTAAVAKRVKGETEEFHRKLQESKEAYEAGLKANEEKFREARMQEEEEKKRKEEERKERVKKREAEENSANSDAPGVPKSHSPAGPAEDVD